MNWKQLDDTWDKKNCTCARSKERNSNTEYLFCTYCKEVTDRHHKNFFVGEFMGMKNAVRDILLGFIDNPRYASMPFENRSMAEFSAKYYAENIHVFCSIFFFVSIGFGKEFLASQHHLGILIVENVFSEQLNNLQNNYPLIVGNGIKCGIERKDDDIIDYLTHYYEFAYKIVFPNKPYTI